VKLAPTVDLGEQKKGDDIVVGYKNALALFVEKS
jgi:hypothetical protein